MKYRYRSIAGDVYDAEPVLVAHTAMLKGAEPRPVANQCMGVVAIFPSGYRVELRAIQYVGRDTGANGVLFHEENPDGPQA